MDENLTRIILKRKYYKNNTKQIGDLSKRTGTGVFNRY